MNGRKEIHTIFAIVASFAIGLLLFGCQSAYKGGNIHDGLNASVGVKLPTASAASNTLQLLWFLNGWVFSWEENAFVKMTRHSGSTTSFCGMYENSTTNVTELFLYPLGTNCCSRLPEGVLTNAVNQLEREASGSAASTR